MGLRYLGNIIKPGYNPLASNITTGVNVIQYQGVFTAQQQLQAQANQQWAKDPYDYANTLLLQADGIANGSQNNTFLDSSSNNFTITRNGNTTQGSFTPFSNQPGAWGNYFTGSDYLSVASNAVFGFGTGDLTIEGWFYSSTSSGQYQYIDCRGSSYTNTAICVFQLSGSYAVGIGTTQVITGGPVLANQWVHVAVTRSGTSLKLFVNGVQSGSTYTDSNNYSAFGVNIGNLQGSSGWNYVGYASNVRVTKGGALYTGTFTPSPIPLTTTVSAGTVSLLTCQSNRFVDNSSNAFTITVNGTPSVQPFSPFAPQYQWTSDVIGGSGYFDGTGDWLNTPTSANLAMGSGDFTIECWVYTPLTGARYIFDIRPSASQALGAYVSSSSLYVNSGSTLDILASSAFVLNAWNHFAYVRSGSGSNNISIYLNGSRVYQRTDTTNYSTSPIVYIAADNTGSYSNGGYISGFRILKGTAQYSGATITLPTAPPTAITNTQLLLNFTNAGIYDGTMKTSWETVSSAQISTSVVKYGSGSLYFNGTSSQRLLPSQAYSFLTPGTGDFTIECWMYVIGKGSTTLNGIIDYRPGINGVYIQWALDFGGYGGSATAPTMVFYVSSGVRIRSDVVPMNQWVHVALCRANGQTKMFMNGVQTGSTYADTNNYLSGGSAGNYRPTIGCTDGGDSAYGYFDDFRISNFARYIANFTPPSVALPRQ